jgi:hypothetical protein
MLRRFRLLIMVLALLLFPAAGSAVAARARFHYAPDAQGNLCLQGATQSSALYGLAQPAECPPPRPTHFLTFRHPCSGCLVTVPICFPLDSTPRIEYRYRRVIYNYGSYTIEVLFLADGSVDVVYNSGLLRAL